MRNYGPFVADCGHLGMLDSQLKSKVLREAALFLGLLFLGMLALPIAIYLVGNQVFGDYGGAGFQDFYGEIHAAIRSGDAVVWFLILSPYLVCQIVRFSFGFFFSSAGTAATRPNRIPPRNNARPRM